MNIPKIVPTEGQRVSITEWHNGEPSTLRAPTGPVTDISDVIVVIVDELTRCRWGFLRSDITMHQPHDERMAAQTAKDTK